MSAQVISFPTTEKQEPEIKEVRIVADCDEGYTRLANTLLDALCRVDITPRQMRVFLAIVRQTYGYQKKSDWVSPELIAQLIGYTGNTSNIRYDLSNLKKRKLLIKKGPHVGPNPVVSEWVLSRESSSNEAEKQNKNVLISKQSCLKTETKKFEEQAPQKKERKKTNTNNKKINKKVSLSEFVETNYPSIPAQSIDAALEHRKAKRTAQTENAAKLFFDQIISISTELGITPSQVIDIVILRDWKGVNVEWVRSHLAKNPVNPSTRTGGRIAYDPNDTSWADGFDPFDPREL